MILGILLAAGHGRRIGGPKALLRLDGETFHERGLRSFREAGVLTVAVVNETVDTALGAPAPGEVRVLNRDRDDPAGMFGSVRLGASAAMELGATGAIFLPVDLPLVTSADIKTVATALDGGAAIVVAAHDGRRGHPIGVSRSVMEEILSSDPLGALRDIVHRDATRVVVAEASAGAILGVNTQGDLERVSNREFSVN